MKGTVKWFSNAKGYGFITSKETGDIFVHYSSILGLEDYKTLNEGDSVEFEIGKSEKGDCATNVKKLQAQGKQ